MIRYTMLLVVPTDASTGSDACWRGGGHRSSMSQTVLLEASEDILIHTNTVQSTEHIGKLHGV